MFRRCPLVITFTFLVLLISLVHAQHAYSQQALLAGARNLHDKDESRPGVESRTSRTEDGVGLTMDPCKQDSQCKDSRTCINVATTDYCENSESSSALCICVPIALRECSTSSDCEDGESCTVNEILDKLCMSTPVIRAIGWTIVVDNEKDPTPPPVPSPPKNCTGGLTFDKCSDDDDCKAKRVCTKRKMFDGFAQVCIPDVKGCNVSEDCDCGEACVYEFTREGVCASLATLIERGAVPVEKVREVLSPEVCIAVEAFKSIPRSQLKYSVDKLANVMCDDENNCATPGHMVEYNGVGMMMTTYCEGVGCRRRVLHVNSPRWNRKLRIESKTDGLYFSAYAARYETRFEEGVLSTILRMEV